MNYIITYDLKLKNKEIQLNQQAKIKKCLNSVHAEVKIENILRQTYQNFDYIKIHSVLKTAEDFLDFFNNIILKK